MLYRTEYRVVKSKQNKFDVVEIRMLSCMSGHTKQDEERLLREKVGIAPIVDKIVESHLMVM